MYIYGFNHKTGEYNGRPYDNYEFFYKDVNKQHMFGSFKVSSRAMQQMKCNPHDICEKEVEVYCDFFGHVERINIL